MDIIQCGEKLRKYGGALWFSLLRFVSLAVKSIFAVLVTFGFKLHCRKNRKQLFLFKFPLNKGTKRWG